MFQEFFAYFFFEASEVVGHLLLVGLSALVVSVDVHPVKARGDEVQHELGVRITVESLRIEIESRCTSRGT